MQTTLIHGDCLELTETETMRRLWSKDDYIILQYLLSRLENNRYYKTRVKINYKTLRKVIGNVSIRGTKTRVKKILDDLFWLSIETIGLETIYHKRSHISYAVIISKRRTLGHGDKTRVTFNEWFIENSWLLRYLRLFAKNESDWNYKGSIYTGELFEDVESRIEYNKLILKEMPKQYRIKANKSKKVTEAAENANNT